MTLTTKQLRDSLRLHSSYAADLEKITKLVNQSTEESAASLERFRAVVRKMLADACSSSTS